MAGIDQRSETLLSDTKLESDVAPVPRGRELPEGTLLAPHFVIGRRLGAGGSGVVYRARDQLRGADVALKVLHLRDPDAIFWLKDEFRALADLVHPNINHLYDLFHESDSDHWFFTMELVEGVPFCNYVAPERDGTPQLDEARLRNALGQLVDGVEAIHLAGKLHRDIKPSNVLVRTDGQLVILDFGLVQDLSILGNDRAPAVLRDRDALICGTPAYMAPEQAAGLIASPASDWYGVGAMLYESLTGRLPHEGDPLRIMLAKQTSDPEPPSALCPELPADLAQACQALLARTPSQRPNAEQLRARLGLPGGVRAAATWSTRPSASPRLFGRETALEALHAAFAAAERTAVYVLVHGPSGIGKTALVRSFLDELAGRPDVVILAARCFERESIPYKAIDGIVDHFAAMLNEVDDSPAFELPGADIAALLRVFPVLSRAGALARRAAPETRPLDAPETRRRAFHALRRIMCVMSEHKRLVLSIDDLQWGDHESTQLLVELLRQPGAPRLLWIGSYREEEAHSSPLLTALLPALDNLQFGACAREIALEPLAEADAVQLAYHRLGERGGEPGQRAQDIAREAAGSPFLIEALAQHQRALGGDGHGASIDTLVLERVAELPRDVQLLLHLIVVAGQPLASSVAERAARLPDARRALSLLRAAQLIRTRGRAEEPALEPYHDRIREALHQHLDRASLAALHAALADAFEAGGYDEPALLARHHYAAGRLSRALPFALRAADTACAALAFSHAAELYELALRCAPDDIATRRLYADTLGNAGRSADAAVQYARLTSLASGAKHRELQARAAQHFLGSGHLDLGLAHLKPLMQAAGWRYPETSEQIVETLTAAWQALHARGVEVSADYQPGSRQSELERIDVARLATDELSHCDPLRAASIMLQAAKPALELGEPARSAWALSRYGLFLASSGEPSALATGEQLSERSRELAAQSGDALMIGSGYLESARLSLSAHRWREGLERAARGAAFVAAQCIGGWRLVGVANNIELYSLLALGRLGELAERVVTQQQRALELGDVYVRLTTHFYAAVVRLAADRPDAARAQLEAAGRIRTHASFLFQDWLILQGQVLCDLYSGELESARERLERAWPQLESAHLLSLAVVREFAHRLRGNLAVSAALARRGHDPAEVGRLLEFAADQAGVLERGGTLLGKAAALNLRGGIAGCERRVDEALAAIEAARACYVAADMPLDAAASAAWHARIAGEASSQPTDWRAPMCEFGVAAPERWVPLHVPWSAS